jgi:hypothetical protein
MSGWKCVLKADPTQWLLSEGPPWVVYHTLVGILDRDEADRDVVAAKSAILQAEKDFDFGQKKAPSSWITLLALRVIKRVSPVGVL